MSSAITFGAIGAAAGVYSASQSGKGGGGGGQTTENQLDPRMQEILYGTDPNKLTGLLGDSRDLYERNRSGLNDQMAQGLNTQWGIYNNPNTMAGYDQMARLGSGLMGAPVMGNPFSDGRTSLLTQGLRSGQPQLGGASFGGSPPMKGSPYPSYQPNVVAPSPAAGLAPGPFSSTPTPRPSAAPAPAASPAPGGVFMGGYQPGRVVSDATGRLYTADENGQLIMTGWGDYGTGNGGA